MTVGMLSGSVSRRGGGVFQSMAILARSLARADTFNVTVIGLRDEFTSEDAKHWGGARLLVSDSYGPKSFGFAPNLLRTLQTAALDLLHVQGSSWMFPSIISLIWSGMGKRPYMISPHGVFDSWALAKSSMKKRIAGFLYENAHLRNAHCIHALCDAERSAIRDFGLRVPVCTIPNPIEVPPQLSTVRQEVLGSTPNLVFLGRIHPKRGWISSCGHGRQRARAQIRCAGGNSSSQVIPTTAMGMRCSLWRAISTLKQAFSSGGTYSERIRMPCYGTLRHSFCHRGAKGFQWPSWRLGHMECRF